MKTLGRRFLTAVLALHLLVLPGSVFAKSVHHGGRQPADEDPTAEADRLANEVTMDAENAKSAAATAKQAAVVANNVAEHSIKITGHAKQALHHALGALHEARVDSEGLDTSQKESLKKAEAKLREATKTADYGKLKKVEEKSASDLKMEKMETDLKKRAKKTSELEQMRQEVKELRRRLKENGGDAESDKELQELESELERLEKAKATSKGDSAANDEMKAEIERLRDEIEKLEKLEKQQAQGGQGEDKELMRDVNMQPLGKGGDRSLAIPQGMREETTPIEEKGIDIDTAMPYGDLEPFGREDTAQELTESSVRESDEMVDQLERAEVAEEKRAVFRALTRLRGAAITSFDGVARSQTGNIDEYNKIHKWRKTHPLHHLADEESDVTKWAFPDNADFVQMKARADQIYSQGEADLLSK
jgi:DNA repair exonuclease SbcCD ATPase subunit